MAPYTLVMGGAYPYMDLNAKYEKLYYDVLLRLIQIRISPKQLLILSSCTQFHCEYFLVRCLGIIFFEFFLWWRGMEANVMKFSYFLVACLITIAYSIIQMAPSVL